MTSLLEKTLSIIAPHRCIICGNYNNIVCGACISELQRLEVPQCVLCARVTTGWRLCNGCASVGLTGIWAAGSYEGVLKQLIRRYKFDHGRDAYKPLAQFVASTLPYLGQAWLVTAIPTVPRHVRERSFDHAQVLAQEVARLAGRPFVKTLLRKQNVQQRGAKRVERLRQAEEAFLLRPGRQLVGKKVVIVDDVCTTGATLAAAARAIRLAGADEVWGAVAAWKRLSGSL